MVPPLHPGPPPHRARGWRGTYPCLRKGGEGQERDGGINPCVSVLRLLSSSIVYKTSSRNTCADDSRTCSERYDGAHRRFHAAKFLRRTHHMLVHRAVCLQHRSKKQHTTEIAYKLACVCVSWTYTYSSKYVCLPQHTNHSIYPPQGWYSVITK